MVGVIAIADKPLSEPDPDKLAFCGLVKASSVRVMIPVRVPSALGVNVTEMPQLAFAASVAGAKGQLEVAAKSPVLVILAMDRREA